MKISLVFLFLATAFLRGAEPIRDERLRMEILSAIFPGMSISVDRGRHIDASWRSVDRDAPLFFPDDFALEGVYRVIGPPSGDLEKCAAQDINRGTAAQTRALRFRAFFWPGSHNSAVLAVVQYEFVEAVPAAVCQSIPYLAKVVRADGKWRVKAHLELPSHRHSGFQGVRLLDLDGDGAEELAVESDSGAPGVAGSYLNVFQLKFGRFDQWLKVPSRLEDSLELQKREIYTQTLDVERTKSQQANSFCFSKTTFLSASTKLTMPIVSVPCYPRFTGMNASR